MGVERHSFGIAGMDCSDCAVHLQREIAALAGVGSARVAFATGRARVTLDPTVVSLDTVLQVVRGAGYDPRLDPAGAAEEAPRWRWRLLRILVVGALVALSWRGPLAGADAPAIAAAVIGGYPIIVGGIRAVRKRRIDVETFLSLGIIGSCLVGEFLAAGTIAFFILIGELLESLTSSRSRKAIRDLVRSAPAEATVRRRDGWERVAAHELRPGDVVLVRPGERIAADGVVVGGSAAVDEASVTGESVPREKAPGDEVFAGTITGDGSIEFRINRVGEQTTLGRIIRMVEDAQDRKAPVQRLADRFVSYFTPIVLSTAAIVFLVTQSIMSAIAVIVVACPCAVALATPLAVVAGIGQASRRGILIKGGLHLENLGRVSAVAFDKTGTLTGGRPRVTAIVPLDGYSETSVLALAALAEKRSEHPAAGAILARAAELGVATGEPQSFRVIRGWGVVANEGATPVAVGTLELLKSLGMDVEPSVDAQRQAREARGETVLFVGEGRTPVGYIAVSDPIRPGAGDALGRLRQAGIGRLVMLSGDNARTAQAVAEQVGVDAHRARMLPEDKVQYVEELRNTDCVAMVGDGVNDAPALAAADVGIAMGAVGTDAALEAADVALMTDDLTRIVEAIRIGRTTFRTIRQNLAIAIVCNVIGISLAAGGFLTPQAAAATHVLPDILVFANSARLLMPVHRREAREVA